MSLKTMVTVPSGALWGAKFGRRLPIEWAIASIDPSSAVSYTQNRAHETVSNISYAVFCV